MATYGYDKNTDYSKLINEAVAAGDYRKAGILEQQRNEKIRGEGLTKYKTTSHYASYLPKDTGAVNSGVGAAAQGATPAAAAGSQGWSERVEKGLEKLANAEPWSYNLDNDPAWQSLRKQYLREADRQTRDTLGSYAGMTGGVPSTAAVTAAQQAGNYQRAQLTDRIPDLMQNDYSRYMQGREADRADVQTLAGLERQAAQDSLAERQYMIQQAMNRWSTLGYADESVAAALGVPVGTTTSDQQYRAWQQQQAEAERASSQEQLDWQRQQTERADAYDRAMRWLAVGQMPDAATLAAAGISQEEANRYIAAAASGGGYGSSGGSGRGSTGDTENTGNEDELEIDNGDDETTPKSVLPQSDWVELAKWLAGNGGANNAVSAAQLMEYLRSKYSNANDIWKWISNHWQDYYGGNVRDNGWRDRVQ